MSLCLINKLRKGIQANMYIYMCAAGEKNDSDDLTFLSDHEALLYRANFREYLLQLFICGCSW